MLWRSSLLALAYLLIASPLVYAKKTKIKMATMAPKGSAFYKIIKDMGNEWKDVSGNKVRLKIYPGGVAGSDVDVVRKIKLGTVNAGMITSAGLATIHKAVNVFQMPATYRSPAELDYAISQLGPQVAAIYEQHGIVILSWGEAGWIRFLSKTPMGPPSERAKQKMFIVAGNSVQTGLWQSAGFNAVPLPVTEISTGLQTGLITAVPSTAQTALMFQWYQHAPHFMSLAWAPMMGAIVVDKKIWDRIEPSMRQQLKVIAENYGRKLIEQVRPGEAKAIEAMQKRGLVVDETPPDVEAEWRKLAIDSKASLRGPYVPEDLFDLVKGHLDTYRKNQAN